MNVNSSLDLVFERHVELSPQILWQAWTTPELLKQWFCPRPWSIAEVEMELRAGGKFCTVMQSPEGERFPNQGSIVALEEGRRLVWTNALLEDFRPRPTDVAGTLDFAFSCDLELIPSSGGTHYRAVVRHADAESKSKHESMGFEIGWGMAFDQLVELAKGLK